LALNDGMRVATAAQFRVSEGNTNVTTTRASVKFTGQTPATALSNSQLVNNPNATAAVTFKVDGARVYTPVTSLSAGVKATFFLDQAEPGQNLQVLTRDGRQLLGKALTETEKYQLFTPDNGFVKNANYSDAYLNQSNDKAYRGLDLFYGAKARFCMAKILISTAPQDPPFLYRPLWRQIASRLRTSILKKCDHLKWCRTVGF